MEREARERAKMLLELPSLGNRVAVMLITQKGRREEGREEEQVWVWRGGEFIFRAV